MALPIWALYYKKLYADSSLNISQEEFEKPENLSIKVNCDETNLDGDNLDDIIEEDPEF
jgi:penicillin-binding protein 1A